MQNIDWKIYRHPKFLQSLDMTLNERKYLNLFLKRNKFENIGKLEDVRQTRIVTVRKGLTPSKFFAQKEVGIDI